MLNRIYAILLQEFYLTRRRLEIIIDLFWFSGMSIVVFGFVARFLVGAQNKEAANFLLIGLILWEVIRVGQYSLSVGPLWNIWSRNLSNLFRTPLSTLEYIVALMVSASIKSLVVFMLDVSIATIFFNFNMLQLGLFNVLFYFLSLLLFSFSIGILILGFIFRFGTRIQALAWGFVFIIQPLTAALFPVSVLPRFLQIISYFLPSTYIFEAARAQLKGVMYPTEYLTFSILQNIIYFILAMYVFKLMYNASKTSGQFAKNDNP